jgi:T5SS/PEP-CTERM-associated repeat protein
MVVGLNGSGSQLIITNGGQVFNASGILGSNSANNSVRVDGAQWINSSTLTIGSSGASNSLTIANGGQVVNSSGIIGSSASGNSNIVLVTGSGSIWTNTGTLTIGSSGSANQLIITNGGVVRTTEGNIGDSGNNNTVLVTGTNSLWNITGGGNITWLVLGQFGGKNNTLTIANGAQVIEVGAPYGAYIGDNAAATNNAIIVTGSNSLLSVTGTDAIDVGNNGWGSQLIITNGGRVNNTAPVYIGRGPSSLSSNNLAMVTGSGSIWSNSAALTVGNNGGANQMIITNGGVVINTTGTIGNTANGNNNLVVVTGSGSVWSNAGILTIGQSGAANQLTITNGGVVQATQGNIGDFSDNNSVLVTGTNSLWNIAGGGANTYLVLGQDGGKNNQLTVANGAQVFEVGTTYGTYIGNVAASTNNAIIVTGSNSLLSVSGPDALYVGYKGWGNQLIITNGGRVNNTSTLGGFIGRSLGGTDGSNNLAIVTGLGSIWSNSAALTVGGNASGNQLTIANGGQVYVGGAVTNGASSGANQISITSSGLLEANTLVNGATAGNLITNSGGVYQFTQQSPTITPNGFGRIAVNSGTISFRAIANADVFGNWNGTLTNISFSGNNTFRLNSASNRNDIAQSYVFDTGRGATNYTGLELVNAGATWRSATLTIGSGGSMLASNANATVAAAFSSTGAVKITGSTISFLSNTVIAGSYRSDPSTNIFAANLTLNPSGYLSGSNGDLFVFQRDFVNQSTNNLAFDLQYASVLFTNGAGPHLFQSSAKDNGANFSGIAAVVTNYAIGTLQLAVGDSLILTGAVANALYVGVLDIGGIANTNNLTLDVNLYYDSGLNPYLGGNTYSLGTGSLIPYPSVVPEPGTLSFLLAAGLLLGLRRRQ